jgi:hypothetical protein
LAVSALFWWQLEHWSRSNIFGPDPGFDPGFSRDLPHLITRGMVIIGLAVLCSLSLLTARTLVFVSGLALTVIALHSVSFKFGFAYFVLGISIVLYWLKSSNAEPTPFARILSHSKFTDFIIVMCLLVTIFAYYLLEFPPYPGWGFGLPVVGEAAIWAARLWIYLALAFLIWSLLHPREGLLIPFFIVMALFTEPTGYQIISRILFVNTYIMFALLLLVHGVWRKVTLRRANGYRQNSQH